MFGGIVRAVSEITDVIHHGDGVVRIGVDVPKECLPTSAGKQSTLWPTLAKGASVAVNGICLTLCERVNQGQRDAPLLFDLTSETQAVSNAKNWQKQTKVNLEPAISMSDSLDGYMVSGHVDAVGKVVALVVDEHNAGLANASSYSGDTPTQQGLLHVDVPSRLAPYLAVKGGLIIDGVALTITGCDVASQGLNRVSFAIVPFTASHTIIQHYHTDTEVNVEVDIIARYVVAAVQQRQGRA